MAISRNTAGIGALIGSTLATLLATLSAILFGAVSCAPQNLDTATPVWGVTPLPPPSIRLELDSYALPPTSPDAPETLTHELQEAVLLPPMEEWPIEWTDERKRLAAQYLAFHKGWDLGPNPDFDALTTMHPKMVVVHWTAGGSAKSAYNTFYNERQKGQRIHREWNEVNLAAHFIVDRDGTIIRLMPETRIGRHTIGLNHLAIGIENVGNGDSMPLTEAQVEANAILVRWLEWRYDLTHLIGHYEYRHFEDHPYFEEELHWFRTGRVDPGEAFMASLRARLHDDALEGSPLSDG